MLSFLVLVSGLFFQPSLSLKVTGQTISDGYAILSQKQGYDEQRYMTTQSLTTSDLKTRYQAVQRLFAPQVRKQNVFWHQIESGLSGNSSATFACPTGYFRWPPTQDAARLLQTQNYHCYNTAVVRNLDSKFDMDRQFNMETAVVLWGCPKMYAHENCTGNSQLGKLPCAPRPENISAWYDFVSFVGSRWVTATHYLIWNEVDSSTWFDPSPYVNNTLQFMTGTKDADTWIQLYANMLYAAHDAISLARPGFPSMLYVSTDRMLTATPWCPGSRWGARCPLGVWNLLEGLWRTVGTSIDWSLSMHAYGVPNASDWKLTQPYQAYDFINVADMIKYQKSWLAKNPALNVDAAPQAIVAASEQSWNTGDAQSKKLAALYICQAYNYTWNTPTLSFVTHLDLQDPYVDSGVASGNIGLIPRNAGLFLNETPGITADTFWAYSSTQPGIWGASFNHFCCYSYGLGCPKVVVGVCDSVYERILTE